MSPSPSEMVPIFLNDLGIMHIVVTVDRRKFVKWHLAYLFKEYGSRMISFYPD